ncbi:MAG: GAF domain-containing sensor histidine kinase, partial [Chloroflexota bacterium]
DIAILSVAFLPASLGAAILGQQFLGVRRFAQRGMIALVVWLGLLVAYTLGLRLLSVARLNSLVLEVAIVAGTFAPLQKVLRDKLESWLLSGVYNYAETLQQLAAEIAALTGVDAIAGHVLTRLARTLDLSWVAIALRDDGSPPLVYHWGDCPTHLDRQLVVATESPDGEDAGPPRTAGGRHLFPLVSEGTTIGHVMVGPKRRDLDLTPEDFALIATIAPLVARSLRNALLMRTLERQVQALSERESALAALSARLMDVQEEERRQLALELHDDPLQRAILLARALGEAPQNPQVQRWRLAVEEIIASLRATCMDLHPPVLDDLGLVPGIERLVNNLRARSDLDVRLRVETDGSSSFGRLDVGLEVALYRVAQEALYNCLKHAKATKVKLTLRKDCERVQLIVEDDGQGYRPADGGERGHVHLGILGMRERLRHWEGVLKVEASAAGGTVVLADVALGGNNAERRRSEANARCDN